MSDREIQDTARPFFGVGIKEGGAEGDALQTIAIKGEKTFPAVDPQPTTDAALVLAANDLRLSAAIYNNGAQTVYMGKDSGVTTETGFPLLSGGAIEDDDSNDAWYGVVASGTADLRVEETVRYES